MAGEEKLHLAAGVSKDQVELEITGVAVTTKRYFLAFLLTCSYFGINLLLLVRSQAVDQERRRRKLPRLGRNDDQMHTPVGFTHRERAFCIFIQVRNSIVIGISVGVAVGRH